MWSFLFTPTNNAKNPLIHLKIFFHLNLIYCVSVNFWLHKQNLTQQHSLVHDV